MIKYFLSVDQFLPNGKVESSKVCSLSHDGEFLHMSDSVKMLAESAVSWMSYELPVAKSFDFHLVVKFEDD